MNSKVNNIAAILCEPIQCTCGDKYFALEFFWGLRKIADNYDIPLIFDEIQVGFGSTGKIWYFEHIGIEPDILVFGKKAQVAGIMVKKKFAKIFDTPTRLEVTWDADIVDMVRSNYIIEAYRKYNVLDNVKRMSSILIDGLKNMKNLKNVRNTGMIIAFDFETENLRNDFVKRLYDNGMICNKTLNKTVRFRPNLYVTKEDISRAIEIVTNADKSL